MSHVLTPRDVAQIVEAGGFHCACATTRQTSRALTQYYDDVLRETGLRITQLPILIGIQGLRSPSISELAEELVVDRTTLTRNLERLEREGMIQIEAGEDLRVREITLTRHGRETLARAFRAWRGVQRKVIDGFGEQRLRRLLKDLSALRDFAKGRS